MKKKTMNKCIALLFLFIMCSSSSQSQDKTFDVGLRFQKAVGLYYENGITGQYNYSRRWVFGASYISSRLGSAIGSNAIKQDNLILSGAYMFRPARTLKPFARASTGYFRADYESDIFNNLDNGSAILALEGGLSYALKMPLRINLSIGYNGITGDGESGAGTLYPVFYQTSIMWNLAKRQPK